MIPVLLLTNLRAEGGPALAADLAAEWRYDHKPVVLLFNDEAMDMADRFDAIGVPYEVLGVPSISPKHYPAIIKKVRSALCRHKADALVSIPSGVHGAIFAGAALAGVTQRIVHVGVYPWHQQSGFWKYRALMRLARPLTPDLVCVSQHVANGVVTHFGQVANRLHIIPNGIDLERFPFRGMRKPSEGNIEVLMVGRLDGDKDYPTLIEAVATLKARGRPVRLCIAGDGKLRAALEGGVAQRGLAREVVFLGARRDVPKLLAEADVFAFSAMPWEGLGIALVEAMAAGIPVVATDVGACREVLDDGRCGTLVPSGDAAALADALEAAARQPNAECVKAARQRAEALYSRAAMAAAYGRLCGLEAAGGMKQ